MIRIYTKSGDKGVSMLYGGERLSKADLIFEVLGSLDEFNSFLGLLISNTTSKELSKEMRIIQNDLFLIGTLTSVKKVDIELNRYFTQRTKQLETKIALMDSRNKPLQNFILPGGTKTSSYLHYGRTLCRKVERLFVLFVKNRKKKHDLVILSYLNRLSDYLFVVARYYNEKGSKDLIWKRNVKIST